MFDHTALSALVTGAWLILAARGPEAQGGTVTVVLAGASAPGGQMAVARPTRLTVRVTV